MPTVTVLTLLEGTSSFQDNSEELPFHYLSTSGQVNSKAGTTDWKQGYGKRELPKHTEKAAAAAHQLSITGYYCSHSTQLGQQDSTACFTVYTTMQSHVSQWHTSSTAEAINVFLPILQTSPLKARAGCKSHFLPAPFFNPVNPFLHSV